MQATSDEQEIIVRGSEAHKDYLRHQFGRIKDAVNSFETRIAVSGRAMLLIYVVYITVKAGVGGSLPTNVPGWLSVALAVLDIVMLALQVLGLEGSVPGLRHLAEELEDKGKAKEAGTVRLSSNIAQWLLAATAIDIVLQRNAATWHIADAANDYTNALFVLRVVVIGLYLVAMAKLEHKGPRVISQHEANQQAQEKEQQQIRIDNANIMTAVEKGIESWAKPMVGTVKTALENQMRQLLEQAATDRAAAKAQMEAMQMASGSALSLAEIGRQVDVKMADVARQIDEKISTSLPNIDALTQHVTRQVCASLPASESIDFEKLTRQISELIDAKFDAARRTSTPARQPATPRQHKPASSSQQSRLSSIPEIGGMGKKAYFVEFDNNPGLLRLNPYELAEKFTGNRNMEPTARRAKKDYLDLHPELRAMAV